MKEKATKCYLKTNEVFLNADGHAYLSLIFVKVQELQIVLRATQTLDVLTFFKKKFCLMSGLKFTLSDVKSFLQDNLSGLEKNHFQAWGNHVSGNEQIQMVFTTEQFLEVAIESWSYNTYNTNTIYYNKI